MKSIYLGHSSKKRQAGNAMLFVLIGIVLFAALTYMYSKTGRSAGKLSLEEAQLNAQQILSYAEKINGAVQMISLQNNCLATQISFENTTVGGYANAGSPANKSCRVFDLAGGGMLYIPPPSAVLDTAAAAAAVTGGFAAGNLVGQYFFTGKLCVDGLGTGELATCESDSADNEELLLVFPWINGDVCAAINRILGNTATMLIDDGASFDNTKFTGAFADGAALGKVGSTTYHTGCYQSGVADTPGAGDHFYYTLLAR